MEQLRTLTMQERAQAYETVFREAFPESELKPLAGMERAIAAGDYAFLGLFRDGEPVCYFCNWQHDNVVLIDYLCVPAPLRDQGIGSRALNMMMAQYPTGTVFLLETEAPVGDPARDALIARRLGFYRRLGAADAGYDCGLFSVRYQVLYWAAQPVETGALQREHGGFYRRSIPERMYRAAVQIPLLPGQSVLPEQDWEALLH